jgi:aminomethyltransferase
VKSCRYGCILNDQGGVIDDLIVFRLEQDKWFIVVNGATTGKDAAHFQKNLAGDAVFTDVSLQTGKVDVQGPLSREVLTSFVADIGRLDYYTFDYFHLLGERALVSRTGYTGELGYEIYFPWEKTEDLWRALLKHDKVKPAGLGARDVLRLEMGYSLYGHELEETVSPLESGLGRFVDFNKDFIGKKALLRQKQEGVIRQIAGLRSRTRRSPRQGHKIFSESGDEVGLVTSGTFSPNLDCGVALGFVVTPYAGPGTAVYFGDDKSRSGAVITRRGFYKGGSLKA